MKHFMVSTVNHCKNWRSQVLQTLQSMHSLYGLVHDFKTEILQVDHDKQSATCSLSQDVSLSGSSHERGECVVSISHDDVLPTVASQETYSKVASSRVECVSASVDARFTSKTSQHDVSDSGFRTVHGRRHKRSSHVSGHSSPLHVLKWVKFQYCVSQVGFISDSMQKSWLKIMSCRAF